MSERAKSYDIRITRRTPAGFIDVLDNRGMNCGTACEALMLADGGGEVLLIEIEASDFHPLTPSRQ